MKLGLIARCDNTGLGNMTYELAKMLNPDAVLLVDSSPFHKGHRQYPQRYAEFNTTVSHGVINNSQMIKFVKSVDIVYTCETFYNQILVQTARQKGVKTVMHYMFEFLEYLVEEKKPLPDILIAPSLWRYQEVVDKFGDRCQVVYLPPPTDQNTFAANREVNATRHNKLLHIAGKAAVLDRNGTNSVINMMKYSKADFELVIRTQTPIEAGYTDSRITMVHDDVKNNEDMYSGYDAMVLPRRYAGLSLPMNEALMSGLPVFMTDVSPNNILLPSQWLAPATVIDSLMTKAMLDVYAVDERALAEKVDAFFESDMQQDKQLAYETGYNNFSPDVLKQKYQDLLFN